MDHCQTLSGHDGLEINALTPISRGYLFTELFGLDHPLSEFSESSYVNGKLHGYSMIDFWDSEYNAIRTRHVLYLDSERHGSWRSNRRPDWSVEVEDPDENGNGHLSYRNSDGDVWGGPYVYGARHGKWIERTVWSTDKDKDTVGEGPIVYGKKR